MREQGLQLIYPPLFPLLIAGQNMLGVPADIAGRLISAVAGAFFVPVAFLLANRLYGPRVARIAAIIATVHPLLVVFGAAVLTEALYLTLAWAGVYYVLRARDEERYGSALLAGTLFGLAYLTRPEAILLPPLAGIWLVLFSRGERRFAVKRAFALIAVFAVLATPYVVFLSKGTGQLRFEGKTPEGRIFSKMYSSGVPLNQIYRGLDPDLTERGLSMMSNRTMIRMAHLSPRDVLIPMLHSAKSNVPQFLTDLGGGLYFGNPIFFGLAVLGLFATVWDREKLVCQGLIVAVSACAILVLTSWPYWHERFQFPLCAAFVLWGAAGLTVLSDWTSATLRQAGVGDVGSARGGRLTLVLTIIVMAGLSAAGVRNLDEVSDGWQQGLRSAKEVGVWMRTLSPPPQRIADAGPTVAFYSGTAITPFPHAAPDVALQYFASKRVDAIVLRSSNIPEPWVANWIRDGIPDARAELLTKITKPDGSTFILYRFHAQDRKGSETAP
jgi:4-amino-4-deoxy-L-arabinose transferase-like glycosyltransferase